MWTRAEKMFKTILFVSNSSEIWKYLYSIAYRFYNLIKNCGFVWFRRGHITSLVELKKFPQLLNVVVLQFPSAFLIITFVNLWLRLKRYTKKISLTIINSNSIRSTLILKFKVKITNTGLCLQAPRWNWRNSRMTQLWQKCKHAKCCGEKRYINTVQNTKVTDEIPTHRYGGRVMHAFCWVSQDHHGEVGVVFV